MLSWRARSHPGRCSEGRPLYGARVQRRGQNSFNILKMLTTWERAQGREEPLPPPSPIQDTRGRGQTPPTVFRHVPSVRRIGRSWS